MENNTKQEVVTLEALEKSWNATKDALRALLGFDEIQKSDPDKPAEEVKKEEVLEKAEDKKEESKEEVEEEKEDEPEEEDDEEESEETEKSLEETIVTDPEVEAAMDVEPFLRQLVKGLDKKFTTLSKSIETVAGQVSGNVTVQKALAKALSDMGDQQMLIANTVEAIGGQPVTSRSVLRKSGERFETPKTECDMSRTQILEKALKLKEEGKLESLDVTKIENRLNKGMALPENIMKILKEDK